MTFALSRFAASLESPAPWLLPHLQVAREVVRAAHSPSVAAALNAARITDDTPRFVDQSALPDGEAYEAFISRTGSVPTRDNLHDLLNGLIWLSHPASKRRLNVLHAEQIALHGTTGERGPMRDALTLFDENAAVLQAPAVLIEALRCRDWSALFIEHREAWASARLVLFGHALLEKLMEPRKPITAHAWLVEEADDAALASSLQPQRLAAKDFLPLPVLGVPGWWAANEEPGFYTDVQVFRPRR